MAWVISTKCSCTCGGGRREYTSCALHVHLSLDPIYGSPWRNASVNARMRVRQARVTLFCCCGPIAPPAPLRACAAAPAAAESTACMHHWSSPL
eukprot:scaffold74490_cov45-Phaeocystis_antarctica.AAC.1